MRSHTVVFIACIALCGVYLFLSHAYIYRSIGRAGLIFPQVETQYLFNMQRASQPIVYVALGDSLTAGVGVTDYSDSYPYRLAQKLSETQALKLQTFAYPGARTSDVLLTHIKGAQNAHPDIVTLLIGTNDIHGKVPLSEFEANYRAILKTLTTETSARIYVISIPYIGSNALILPPHTIYFDNRTGEFNAVIERLAREFNVSYIDIAEATRDDFKKDTHFYAADSFHPSSLGYAFWSNLIYAGIHH